MIAPPLIQALRFFGRVLYAVLAAIGLLAVVSLQFGWIRGPVKEHFGGARDVAIASDKSFFSAGSPATFTSQFVPVDTNLTYNLSAQIRTLAPAGSERASARTYIGVICYDQEKQPIMQGIGAHRYATAKNRYIYSSIGWVNLTGELSGEGDMTPNQFAIGTKFVRLVLILNYKHDPTSDSAATSTEVKNVTFVPRVNLNRN